MTNEILLAGFGGQGILFMGKMLAYFGLYENKEVSWLPSYGPEMRGGTCNCSVCVSDDPIGSPLVANEHDMKGLANIILVGKLLKETNLTSMETVKKAMEKVIPPKKAHLIDANIKAIELGMAQ